MINQMQALVHFSNIKNEIISQLKKATSDIKVAIAWLTDEDIIRTLMQQAEKGLNVQVVMSESKENFRNTTKWKEFLRWGGKLHVAAPKFLHHKFCIIDGKIIINGSYNWTYFAQRNEENILIMTLDNVIPEDSKLLMGFEAKHRYICDKASQQIHEIGDLNQFREQAIASGEVLAKIDEEEIKLRQELEEDVRKSFAEARSININISEELFKRMREDGGGVEFIKRILHDEISSKEMKSGFQKLIQPERHRVDLSLEYLVSRPKYHQLFSAKEVEFCIKLMEKYNL